MSNGEGVPRLSTRVRFGGALRCRLRDLRLLDIEPELRYESDSRRYDASPREVDPKDSSCVESREFLGVNNEGSLKPANIDVSGCRLLESFWFV